MSREEHAFENRLFAEYYYHDKPYEEVEKIWREEEARRNNVDDIHEIFTEHELEIIDTCAVYVYCNLANGYADFCRMLGREDNRTNIG